MTQIVFGALFSKGISQTRPSYFNGKHFSQWKTSMDTLIKSYDVKVWNVINLGYLPVFSTNKDKDRKKLKDGEASIDNIPNC